VFGYAPVLLADITTAFRGEYITKKDSRKGTIPVILGGQEPAYYIDRFNHKGKIVAIARSGVSAGFVSFWDEPIFLTDGFGFEAKRMVDIHYLYYELKRREPELNAMKRGAGVPHLSGSELNQLVIHLPSLSRQKECIRKLDKLDTLCHDISSGLPAEIEARKKQYEYYRDKLLSFKEKKG
jgi:type I restriction enzyme S subunit